METASAQEVGVVATLEPVLAWARAIMSAVAADRKVVRKTRVFRDGERPSDAADWSSYTPGERMNAVWDLTCACLAWQMEDPSALRLQRSVSRVQRSRR